MTRLVSAKVGQWRLQRGSAVLAIDVQLGALLFAQDPNDLGSIRKAAFAVLGKNQNTVGGNIEDAAAAFEKFGLYSELLGNIGRQTGGARQIISTRAVFDRDMHQSSPVLKRYPSLHISTTRA
jgi:hypothetical protein